MSLDIHRETLHLTEVSNDRPPETATAIPSFLPRLFEYTTRVQPHGYRTWYKLRQSLFST